MEKILLCILATSILTGCATSVYSLSEEEKEGLVQQTYQHPNNDVFSACVQRLTERGWVINNSDRESGLITTEWRQNEGTWSKILSGNMRAKTSVTVIPLSDSATQVKLNVQFQQQGAFGTWEQQKVTKQYAEDEIKPFFNSIQEKLES